MDINTLVMTTMWGSAILNVSCGLFTNGLSAAHRGVSNRVLGWWQQGKTPENHDVLRATHNAYVAAMRVMARAATDIAVSDDERATARQLTKLCAEKDFYDFRWDGEHLPLDQTETKIDALLDRQQRDGDAATWRAYNQLILDDLTVWGIDRNPLLDTLFLEGVGHHAPWHLCFREQFAEIVKADEKRPEGERAFRILTLEALAELKGMGAVVVGGLTRIEAGVDSSNEKLDRLLAMAEAQQAGRSFSDSTLRAAIARFVAIRPDACEAEVIEEIARFERDYHALRERLAQIEVIDNRVATLKADAEAALAEPDVDLDRARALYGEATRVARERLAEPVKNAAQLCAAEAEVAMLARDWEAAHHGWADAESMLAPFDRAGADATVRRATEKLLDHGTIFGARGALDAAIARARAMQARLRNGADAAAFGAWSNWLGIALKTQGERTGGAEGLALLADAVTAYRDALTVYTQAAMPADWAMTQNNLGTALRTQGERTGGAEGLTLLADAVTAYRDALTVYTKAAMPAEWAATQNNLGTALSTRGERTGVRRASRCWQTPSPPIAAR